MSIHHHGFNILNISMKVFFNARPPISILKFSQILLGKEKYTQTWVHHPKKDGNHPFRPSFWMGWGGMPSKNSEGYPNHAYHLGTPSKK